VLALVSLLVLDRDLLLLVLLLSMVLKATRRGAALVDWNLAALIGDLGLLRNLRHIDGKDALVPVALELVQLGFLWQGIATLELTADVTMLVGSFLMPTVDQELIALLVHRHVHLVGLELLAVKINGELGLVVLDVREPLAALDRIVLIVGHQLIVTSATAAIAHARSIKGRTKAKVLVEDGRRIVEHVPVIVAKKPRKKIRAC